MDHVICATEVTESRANGDGEASYDVNEHHHDEQEEDSCSGLRYDEEQDQGDDENNHRKDVIDDLSCRGTSRGEGSL